MSFLKTVKDYLSSRKHPEVLLRDKLADYGITVIQDERLKDRIEAMEFLHEFVETPIDWDYKVEEHKDKDGKVIKKARWMPPTHKLSPEEKIEKLNVKTHVIDRLMRKISIPYGRGGTMTWYGEAMKGWEKLYALAQEIISNIKNRMVEAEIYSKIFKKLENTDQTIKLSNKPIINKEDLVHKLEAFLIVEVYRYALWVSDVSYYESDVTPAPSIVVQQMTSERGGGPGKQQDEAGLRMLIRDELERARRR